MWLGISLFSLSLLILMEMASPIWAATTRDNALVELLGNGDGTFQSAINYFSGTTFLGLQSADLNADSRTDIVAGTGNSTVGVFLNAGGTSRAQTSICAFPFRQSCADSHRYWCSSDGDVEGGSADGFGYSLFGRRSGDRARNWAIGRIRTGLL